MEKNILVVDDSAVIRRFLVKLFEENGYKTDIAKNGAEAVEKVKSNSYSLVTLDISVLLLSGPGRFLSSTLNEAML